VTGMQMVMIVNVIGMNMDAGRVVQVMITSIIARVNYKI
jgi:hypothetical protein